MTWTADNIQYFVIGWVALMCLPFLGVLYCLYLEIRRYFRK